MSGFLYHELGFIIFIREIQRIHIILWSQFPDQRICKSVKNYDFIKIIMLTKYYS